MQPWRRRYILALGEHPFRLMAVVGICAAIGLVIGYNIYQAHPTPIVLPPERAWQQPAIGALGSDGFVYLMSAHNPPHHRIALAPQAPFVPRGLETRSDEIR